MDREQIAKQQQLIEEYFFLAYFYIYSRFEREERGRWEGEGEDLCIILRIILRSIEISISTMLDRSLRFLL